MTRRVNPYAGMSPTTLTAATTHPEREKPGSPKYTCAACQRSGREGPRGGTPLGWHKLRYEGPLDGDQWIPQGYACSQDCLTVIVLRPYGLTRQQVLAWLYPDPPD
jgi:hypothetical protein